MPWCKYYRLIAGKQLYGLRTHRHYEKSYRDYRKSLGRIVQSAIGVKQNLKNGSQPEAESKTTTTVDSLLVIKVWVNSEIHGQRVI
jgi:hypothetical protein